MLLISSKKKKAKQMVKIMINDLFRPNSPSLSQFSPNTVHLQLPHSKEAFWAYRSAEKYERIHKLNKNREKSVNSYVV